MCVAYILKNDWIEFDENLRDSLESKYRLNHVKKYVSNTKSDRRLAVVHLGRIISQSQVVGRCTETDMSVNRGRLKLRYAYIIYIYNIATIYYIGFATKTRVKSGYSDSNIILCVYWHVKRWTPLRERCLEPSFSKAEKYILYRVTWNKRHNLVVFFTWK